MTETITIHKMPSSEGHFDQDVRFAVEHLLYWLSLGELSGADFPASEFAEKLKGQMSLSGALADTLGSPPFEKMTLPLVVRKSTAQELARQIALIAISRPLSCQNKPGERLEEKFLGLLGIICLLASVCNIYPYQILDETKG